MKKILALVALALSGSVFAQSSVTLSGEARMFFDNSRTGNAQSVNSMVSDQSHVGIKGSEDLGNGLKANFNVDTFILMNTPAVSSFGDRQSTLGLSNQYGSVDVGRKTTALKDVADQSDPFMNRYGSTFGVIHNLQSVRLSNGFFVKSAKFAGFEGAYTHGMSNAANVSDTNGGSVQWSGYGFNAHYAGEFAHATGAKTNLWGGSYTFAPTKTLVGLDSSTSYAATAAPRQQGTTLVVSQPFAGRWLARGTYGQSTTDTVADKTKSYSLGVQYAMSKRTAFEAAYTNSNLPGTVLDTRAIGVGMVHSF